MILTSLENKRTAVFETTIYLIFWGYKSSTNRGPNEDCTKDGGEEFFTEMHFVRITNL